MKKFEKSTIRVSDPVIPYTQTCKAFVMWHVKTHGIKKPESKSDVRSYVDFYLEECSIRSIDAEKLEVENAVIDCFR